MKMQKKCDWCLGDPLYEKYHDEEWGVPLHDDQLLYEFLVLEGMQAGLSWLTILRKREAFQAAFSQFDPKIVSTFGEKKIDALMRNPAIIRNKRKIEAAITNAKMVLKIQEGEGSFAKYIWQFVDGSPIHNAWHTMEEVPCETPLSKEMAKSLKKEGFAFVGPTTCYSFMQAVGMVNDHLESCFRANPLKACKP